MVEPSPKAATGAAPAGVWDSAPSRFGCARLSPFGASPNGPIRYNLAPMHPSARWLWLVALALPVSVPAADSPASSNSATEPPGNAPAASDQIAIPLQAEAWTGDLDGMLKRREVRVLVTYSRANFWVERGHVWGMTYRAFQAFEDELNARHKTGHKDLRHHVVFVPVRRDEMIPSLLAGKGDVAAAALSITPERRKVVDFTNPVLRDVSQIAVTGPGAPSLDAVEDLAGREVFVRRASSYWERIEALNQRFAAEGRPAVRLRAAPEELEDEDILEMVNAGLVGITIVDDVKARLWAKVYSSVVLHPRVVVETRDEIAWVFRKDSPLLARELNAFIQTHGPGTAFENELLRRYTSTARFVKAATNSREMKKFEQLVSLFRKYATEYDVDYLLSMAQGYQESELDQGARSDVGAIGVMQLMPATGKELAVGDVTEVEPNVHGGIKYLRKLIDEHYSDPSMSRIDRTLLAFAAYNAGPARVDELQREAKRRGLDPNVWFNNVEVVAADRIGPETVTYVANIFKYYVAYRYIVEDEQRRARAESVAPAGPTGR
jgi:membrane-bound lytic murein transglycosylase MltF